MWFLTNDILIKLILTSHTHFPFSHQQVRLSDRGRLRLHLPHVSNWYNRIRHRLMPEYIVNKMADSCWEYRMHNNTLLLPLIFTPGKGSTCTPSVYYIKSIWPVSAVQLTCINKHAADRVTKFDVSLYLYFNFGSNSENVICYGNEYW